MPLGNGQVGFAIKRHQREIEELIGKIDLANIPWSAKLIVEGITLCCVVSAYSIRYIKSIIMNC